MDHAMNYLREYMSYSVDELRKEHNSGKYKRLSNCPTYTEVKAYCDSYNSLERYYHVKGQRYYLSPTRLLEEW